MNSSQEVLYLITDTPFGRALVACTLKGLAALHFIEGPAHAETDQITSILEARFPRVERLLPLNDRDTHMRQFQAIRSALALGTGFDALSLDLAGSTFQRLVWEYLRTIPIGETRTYQDAAYAIGKPNAYRAVANACAQNEIALVVPCHRIIRSDGTIGGYRWETSRKQQILAFERTAAVARNINRFSVTGPKKLVISSEVG